MRVRPQSPATTMSRAACSRLERTEGMWDMIDTAAPFVKPPVDTNRVCVHFARRCPASAAYVLDGDDPTLALALADAADEITLRRFAAVDLVVETKPDATPVSDADRAVEHALRERLAETYPEDAVLGEEQGLVGAQEASRRWVIDPVDGTKNFIRAVPVWATLLALEVDGRVEVGVVSAPALGIRWWAARGQGAWRPAARDSSPRRLGVSRVGTLSDASLSYSSLSG